MANTITAQPTPTGGLVLLNMQSADAGTWTLVRNSIGETTTSYTLFSGPNPGGSTGTGEYAWIFLDVGDGSTEPLDQTLTYTYTFTTTSGSVTTDPVSAACAITLEMDPYLPIVFRALKAGFTSLQYPSTFQRRPTVQIAMPLTGTPTMPIVSLAPALMQQRQVPISAGVNTDYQNNFYTIQEQVMRRYSLTVFAMSPDERDYLTVAAILMFKGLLAPVLGQMGMDVHHDFQAAYSQVVEPAPGFYYSEVSLEFQGQFVAGIKTNYGPVNHVAASVNGSEV